jgi:dTDP-4-amino-4,6-dideoxygalactose transaminase/predicted dehydrogenase
MKGKMNIAIVGLGARGFKYAEAVSHERCRNAQLVAVCDPMIKDSHEKLAKFKVRLYDNLDSMLAREAIDIAIVALPHHVYLEVIEKLAKHKINIIKEKPFATSTAEAKAIDKIIREYNVAMMIGVQRRFDPHYQVFKQMIGKIGKVSHINGKYTMNIPELGDGWRAKKALSGGGALLDMGYHLVDLLIWCFGVPDDITLSKTQGSKANQQYDVEDSVFLNFEYFAKSKNLDEKAIGSFFISRVTHSKKESMTIQGQRGCIKLKPNKMEVFDLHNQLLYTSVRETAIVDASIINMINHFVGFLQGDFPKLKSNYTAHYKHISLIEAAYRADTTYAVQSYASIKQKLTLSPSISHGIKREREVGLSTSRDMKSPQLLKKLAMDALGTEKPDFVWPLVTDDTKKAVLQQLNAADISIYNSAGIFKEFENRFAGYHQRKYALVTNSGTNAIFAMYEGIALMPGDEVLVPAYTFHATISPLMYTGAVPVFCDCLPNGSIDPADMARKITGKTKAAIVTHLWGIPCDMDPIVALCRQNNIKLLEDCSHAHGARYKGRLVGTFGDAAAWSLNGQKIISGGEGGILLTDDKDIEVRANLQGQYNGRAKQMVPKDHRFFAIALTGFGLKNRAATPCIAMANEQFSHLDDWLKYKRLYAGMFMHRLADIDFLSFPDITNTEPSWYAFTFNIDVGRAGVSREEFIAKLHAIGLKEISSPGSTCPQNKLPLYTQASLYRPGLYSHDTGVRFECPNADNVYANTIKMPMWATAKDLAMVDKYIEGIREVALQIANGVENTQLDPLGLKSGK